MLLTVKEIRTIARLEGILNQELASAISVNRDYLSQLLNGKRKISQVQHLNLDKELRRIIAEKIELNTQTLVIMAKNTADDFNYIQDGTEIKKRKNIEKSNKFYVLIQDVVKPLLEKKILEALEKNPQDYNNLLKSDLHFKSSVGSKEVRADVGWSAILYEPFSGDSTQRGIYPCLLASMDHSEYYMVIMLGVATIKCPKKTIPEYVEKIRKLFGRKALEMGFAMEGISLGDNSFDTIKPSDRCKNYELATIFSQKIDFYHFENSLNKTLLECVKLFNYMIPGLMEYSPIVGLFSNQLPEKDDAENDRSNTRTIQHEKYMKLLEKRNELNEKIGRAAEEFIYNSEKKRLSSFGRVDLAKDVKLIARSIDGTGFDVESWDIKGMRVVRKVIEVKGTSLHCTDEFKFYMTNNEVEFAKRSNSRAINNTIYSIALVHNVLSSDIALFDELVEPFNEENTIESKPVTFKCSYKKKR